MLIKFQSIYTLHLIKKNLIPKSCSKVIILGFGLVCLCELPQIAENGIQLILDAHIIHY